MIAIKINFSMPSENIPVSNQKELNSYIHRCVGKNNKFHDAFSNFCISSLQGGKLNTKTNTLEFNDNPYILMTAYEGNKEFVKLFLKGAENKENTLFGMHSINEEFLNYKPNEYYDLVYMASPVLLKARNNGEEIKMTFKDKGFIENLKANCLKKLEHVGIKDESFNIEIHNIEKAKVKKIMVGDIFNICTQCSFIVRGKKETRDMLYNLGIGNSTGSGFGMIKIQ